MTFYDDRHHYRHFSIDALRNVQALLANDESIKLYSQAVDCAVALSTSITEFDKSPVKNRSRFLAAVHYPHIRDLDNLESKIVQKNALSYQKVLEVLSSLKFNLEGLAEEINDATLTIQDIFIPDLVETIVKRQKNVYPFRFRSQWSNDFPPVQGSIQHINVVFDNLFSNSIKYRSHRPLKIVIRGWVEPRSCYVGFSDNGLGIPRDKLGRLGSPGARFHPEVAPGEGLGLATIKRIMEKHDGSLKVRSEEGRGTEIILVFPNIRYG